MREVFRVELGLRRFFEAPTIAGLGRAVEEVRRAGETETMSLSPVERTRDLPLSYAQERLWFVDQLEPCRASYNLLTAVRVMGRLNVEALEHAFAEVVQRHEALRTRIGLQDGRNIQVVDPEWTGSLKFSDLSGLEQTEREKVVHQEIASERSTPFDLTRGPLMRLRLFKLDAVEHVLPATLHHIISDGWSLRVLLRDVTSLYDTLTKTPRSPLPDLKLQYADYAVRQRDWLKGRILRSTWITGACSYGTCRYLNCRRIMPDQQ